MSELTRDYQVNRDIYQDLLKRRENARVSMNLDTEKQGLSFKIQEPALLPLEPTGLRFIHFVVGGLLAGILLPIGLIYAKLQAEPRIYVGQIISEKHKLPLLAIIPHMWSPTDIQAVRREVGWLTLTTTMTVLVVVAVSVLRFVKVI